MSWIPQLLILGEVALAIVLGGLIGLEREAARKPAGFRTHMLVAGAAALLVGLSDVLVSAFVTAEVKGVLQADPIRIVEAIITGISFLGAGTIFVRGAKDRVEGLTTAASLLFSAAVGIAVALEQFVLAVGVSILALIVLRVIKGVERRFELEEYSFFLRFCPGGRIFRIPHSTSSPYHRLRTASGLTEPDAFLIGGIGPWGFQ